MLVRLVYTVISSINYQIYTAKYQKLSNKTASGANNSDRKKYIRPRIPIIYGQSLGEHLHKISDSNDEYNLKSWVYQVWGCQ